MRHLIAFLVVLLAGLQTQLWSGPGSLTALWDLDLRIAVQQRENEQLAERNRSLAAEVRDLKEGLEAVEERARSDMGMVGAGEVFFQIIEPPQPPGEAL